MAGICRLIEEGGCFMLMLHAGTAEAGYLDVFLDALFDTAIIIPVLIAVHLLIEFFEARSLNKLNNNKVLKGGFAPLIATGVGLLPQCGFSVVASEMYSKKYIRIGTLAAVFIATSDEALPIMIGEAVTNPAVWVQLAQLILIKIVMAVAIGYALNFVFRKRSLSREKAAIQNAYGCCGHAVVGAPKECAQRGNPSAQQGNPSAQQGSPRGHMEAESGADHGHAHGHGDGKAAESKARHVWHTYIKHPLVHTLIITAFIFAVNMILGTVIFFITEEALAEFMYTFVWLQPLFAALVGLIPNCASSVLITEMFISGSLTLGATVAGLAINAGMGFAVLFKENKNFKENILMMIGLLAYAIAAGYLITAIVR